jgi:hypothetical protein
LTSRGGKDVVEMYLCCIDLKNEVEEEKWREKIFESK